ncbi:unnamed protein product [Closterium sp. NIES-64]|nr:unnamed protein product [Closterium sp. NIES-64]
MLESRSPRRHGQQWNRQDLQEQNGRQGWQPVEWEKVEREQGSEVQGIPSPAAAAGGAAGAGRGASGSCIQLDQRLGVLREEEAEEAAVVAVDLCREGWTPSSTLFPCSEGIGKVVQVAVDDHPPPRKAAAGSTKPGASGRQSAPRAAIRDARPRLGREGRAGETEAAASLVSPASLASPPALVSPSSPVSPPSLAARPDEPLASPPPPQAPGHASSGPTATSAAKSAATLAATSGAELAAEDDLLVRLPKGREMLVGREEGVKRASEAAVHVPKETQLVASRNVATAMAMQAKQLTLMSLLSSAPSLTPPPSPPPLLQVATAMAMRAKQLQADLKAARRDAMDARERCRAVEEENERLRAALAAAEETKGGVKGEGMGGPARAAGSVAAGEGAAGGEEGSSGARETDATRLPPFFLLSADFLSFSIMPPSCFPAPVLARPQLHEQLGVLLQEKAQLVAGKAVVERENEMLHHLLLYYEHLYLRGGSTTPGAHHALAEAGHVLSEGGGGRCRRESVDCWTGGINPHPGNLEAESRVHAADMTSGDCAGVGGNREAGQEKAEEHTGPPSFQQQMAAADSLDEARGGSVVGEGAEAGGPPSLLQQVAAGGSSDEAGGGREACGLTEPGGGGETGGGAEASGGAEAGVGGNREEGHGKAEEHDGPPSLQQKVAVAVLLDDTMAGKEACGGAEAGGDGSMDGSSDGARVNGAISGGAEEELKGGAGRMCAGSGGVDDCTGSKVYAGS